MKYVHYIRTKSRYLKVEFEVVRRPLLYSKQLLGIVPPFDFLHIAMCEEINDTQIRTKGNAKRSLADG